MIVGRAVSQKMAPVLRQVYDQMAEPQVGAGDGVCASSGGMFNNYAVVQGVDHVVPVDIYLFGCPPRPEMLLHAILTPARQDRRDAAGRAPRRGGGGRRAGSVVGHADDRAQRPAAVTQRDNEKIAVRRGMFGINGGGDTSGTVRLAGARGGAAGQHPAALRRLLRRGGRPADRAARGRSLRGGRRAGRVFRDQLTLDVRREHLLKSSRRRCATTRRCGSSCPAAFRVCISRGHRPGTARLLPADVDHPQPAYPARGGLPGRRSPCAVAVSVYPTQTGTSARPTTSSASSSTVTPD